MEPRFTPEGRLKHWLTDADCAHVVEEGEAHVTADEEATNAITKAVSFVHFVQRQYTSTYALYETWLTSGSCYAEGWCPALEYLSPDEIAECFLKTIADDPSCALDNHLYQKIWNEVVPRVPTFVGDNWSDTNITNWWGAFTWEECRLINKRVREQQEKDDRLMANMDEGEGDSPAPDAEEKAVSTEHIALRNILEQMDENVQQFYKVLELLEKK